MSWWRHAALLRHAEIVQDNIGTEVGQNCDESERWGFRSRYETVRVYFYSSFYRTHYAIYKMTWYCLHSFKSLIVSGDNEAPKSYRGQRIKNVCSRSYKQNHRSISQTEKQHIPNPKPNPNRSLVQTNQQKKNKTEPRLTEINTLT